MFHSPTIVPAEGDAPWSETVRSGDIVAFRFPAQEGEAGPEPKARPCLVIATATIAGQRWLTVAYGTTALGKARKGYAIRVRTREAVAAGLDRATTFRGERVVIVRANHRAFAINPALRTPVIGRLAGSPLERMRWVQARLQAEADMASERRAERRRAQIDDRKSIARAQARAAARNVITG